MRNLTRRTSLAVVGAVLCSIAFTAVAAKDPDTWEGLNLSPQKRFDAVYLKPGATFGDYTEIMLEPLQVSFDRNWDPKPSSRSLHKADTAKIKQQLADEFRKVFEETLQAEGKFKIVTEAGPNTLRIAPQIVDLYINAPDLSMQQVGRVTTYTLDPGKMTLEAEFRDAPTGTLLARVVDRKQGVDRGYFQITNSVTNLADARRALKQWATAVREGLDSLRTSTATSTR